MGTSYAISKASETEALLSTMSSELQDILAEIDIVTRKSADLQQQILSFENRQECLGAALEESRKIAGDISNQADQRVNSVLSYAESIMAPQQQEIAGLDLEIAAINHELGSRTTVEPALPADLVAPALNYDYSTPANIIDLADYMNFPSSSGSPGQEKICEQDTLEAKITVEPVTESQMQTELSSMDIMEIKEDHNDINDEPVMVMEAGIEEPEDTYLDQDLQTESEKVSASDNSLPLLETETPGDNHTSITEGMLTKNEDINIMNLDTNVNAWHAHSTEAWEQEQHNHNWNIKIQVEVPEDEQTIIYGQVLSAIISTLSRYDDVLLNDVFPFNLIDPTDDNVAGYFFNCLEDTVMMKDLRLIEISLWENETLFMQVTERHNELDEMLKGDDIIERMRTNLLAKSQVGEIPADNAGKKRRGLFGWR